MAEVTLRPIVDDELAEFVRATDLAFGFVPPASHIELERGVVEPDRTIAAEADGLMVGTAAAYSKEMTLPAGLADGPDRLRSVPVAAVTNVGVRPTHHRRGVLGAMMVSQLSDVAERGEAAAVLLASEAGIYRRFGYGVATEHEAVRIDVRRAGTLVAAPARHLRLVSQAEAASQLSGVFESERRRRAGQLSRSEAWWACVLSEASVTWKSLGRGFVVVASHHPDGPASGYALYKVDQSADVGDWTVDVVELAAADPGTDAALWHYLTTLDLVATVRAAMRPIDEPHRTRLVDPRRLEVTGRHDGLWVRPLDVGALLSGRGYAAAGGVTLGVVDDFARRHVEAGGGPCPFDTTGVYRIEADASGTGACTPVDAADPDLVCDVADLGAACLGHTSWHALVWAGLVEERQSGAAAAADALFATTPAPHCATRF